MNRNRIVLGTLAVALLFAVSGCFAPMRCKADTLDPMLYAVESVSLEAHHGTVLASSGVGSLTHIGVDYGEFAIEGVIEAPLYRTQQHTRRSVSVDVLWFPTQPIASPAGIGTKYVGDWIIPYAVGGVGYYWGSDPFQCLAADLGVGCRFYVSNSAWLQIEAKDAFPYDGHTLVIPARFQVVSVGIGGRY